MKQEQTTEQNFSLKERIQIQNILPLEGNFKQVVLIKDIKEKVKITQDELKKYEVEILPDLVKWNKLGDEEKKFIVFTELEMNELRLALKKLSSSNKLSIDLIDLCYKFNVTE